MSAPTGIERVWHEAAYFAALVEYLVEHKTDNETDAEVAESLKTHPWFLGVLIGVLKAHEQSS